MLHLHYHLAWRINNMNQSHRKIPLFLIALVCGFTAVTVLVYFVFVIQKKSASVASASDELTQLEETRNARLTLKKTLFTTEGERDTLSSYFVDSTNVVQFIETIEGFAAPTATRLEITNVEVVKEKKTLSLSILATGQFQNVYHLVRMLETMPVEISFSRLSLSRAGDGVEAPAGAVSNGLPLWNAAIDIELISFGS